VNFGIMYGIGPFGLGNRLEITQSRGERDHREVFRALPKVKQYINDTIAGARREGLRRDAHGAKAVPPRDQQPEHEHQGNAERQAINMPIQGTAADMIKIAMIRPRRGHRRNGPEEQDAPAGPR